MLDTSEYYGGTYPDPPEIEENEIEEDYEGYMADVIYEERELGKRIKKQQK